MPASAMIEGRLARGLGQAAHFTRLEWVRRQLSDLAGIDPFPGTVNLTLDDERHRLRWADWRRQAGLRLDPAEPSFCAASCYPVRVEGRIPAAIVVPHVDGYPPDKVELVAALPLCRHLALEAGMPVRVESCRPLAAKAVLFDLDGTLVDTVGAYVEIARLAATAHGFEVTEQHVRDSLCRGGSFWSDIVPDAHPEGPQLRRALTAHAAREWPRVLRERGRRLDGLLGTLDALKRKGLALAIVSGARPEVLELLRDDDLLARFDAVVLGADVARRKPDPEGLLKALDRLGVAPADAVYVGDAPIDIEASRAAGMRAVAVLTGAGDSARLSAHEPDRLIASHAKLDAIIASG
jgi:HAD superfamily hydrolase (TIGR01509 family)